MKPDDQTRLRHMLDAALEAVSFLGDLDAEGLAENRLVCQAANSHTVFTHRPGFF